MLSKGEWRLVDNTSPGYVGSRRNKLWVDRDSQYGKGNWRSVWLVEGDYLEYEEVCRLYEDAYFEYFKKRPELLECLLETASDVYDDDPSNVESGLDYSRQGSVRTHIQDIAIRNCVKRFGKTFKGEKLLQIRDREGEHSLSLALSPGQVPFHRPELLSDPDNLPEIRDKAWWLPLSVEDFYQRAKRLAIRK
ncbi:MAG: hypothetical protein ACM3TN_05140 [Alphaproteobacteria bacterium]